ncbi:MAG: Gfo/Idh/MocA family oxidoreductase [Prochlorococcaceae cyanobacterium]
MSSSSFQPLRFAIVGCGAISELYYAPALLEASKHLPIDVVALFDPSPERSEALLKWFPNAVPVTQFEDAIAASPELALVASPPSFHATQANTLLEAGVHVLCEKPMASSVAEAETMIAAARKANRVLAIGLFRRFFPALQTIKALVSGGALGAAQSFRFEEGGVFNWPAASASFFQKQSSQGGVLLDLGVHILDLICWWFGEPASVFYEDDAMGNLEANSRLSLTFTGGLTGVVRMSRDTPCSNTFLIEFERGRIIWKVGDGNHLDVRLNGLPFDLIGELREAGSSAPTYHQSFVKQLLNVVSAARGMEPELVPGDEGIRSLRLIEQCYAIRQLIPMPWLTESEVERALKLAAGVA